MQKRSFIRQGAELRKELGYITEHQAAGLLGVSLPTFRNRQSLGSAPPFYKLGREKLFRVDEVDAWIRRGRRG